jgi:hypothetical protein
MKLRFLSNFKSKDSESTLVVLVASCRPRSDVLESLAQQSDVHVREAFTTRGVLQNLQGANLIILDDVLALADTSPEILARTLELSGIPRTSPEVFLSDPDEWLGRARLTSARRITFLPTRQINLVNWSGGVGKTTLAMVICKRFVERAGLPAALLELSMRGSALHARISQDLPEFFNITTHKKKPHSG